MIDHLDTMLFRLLRWQVGELTGNGQVRFQPPDEAWRAMVPGIADGGGNPANSLNVYLVDLRENRKLRTNERERTTVGPDVYETPPPRRVDCHYLISAWSPVQPAPGLDPTPDEHALLAEAARVLGQYDALDPAEICAATRAPNLPAIPVPPPLLDEILPLTLLPVEGFPKYAEFWGTMGDKNRWKPCIYAVVTVALKESPVRSGPIVTTMITNALQVTAPGSIDTRYHIGGEVRDAAVPAQPVPGAWIELLNNAGTARIQLTRADGLGRFVFADIAVGSYQLRATANPQGTTAARPITVPEPTGNYDLKY
jgi:Pvc16 N-terminal domain/Carboxypeptidase regulatory-like domain